MLGRIDLVKLLLSAGGSPRAKNRHGCTPMHSVFLPNERDLRYYIKTFEEFSFEGFSKRLEDMLQAMKNARRNSIQREKATEEDEANAEKRRAILRLLHEAGGDPGAKDKNNRTLLHLAAITDLYMEAEWLLDLRSDRGRSLLRSAYDDDGFLPLHYSAQLDNLSCTCVFLSKGADTARK